MKKQHLTFNLLTIEWPLGPVPFYFTNRPGSCGKKLSSTHYPKKLNSLFPGFSEKESCSLFTSFLCFKPGFKALNVNFRNENPELIKRFYCNQIVYYFSSVAGQLVLGNASNHSCQVWIKDPENDSLEYESYNKFSLNVQLAEITSFPELIVAYQGQAVVCRKTICELIHLLEPGMLSLVVHQNKLINWHFCPQSNSVDAGLCYPVMSNKMMAHLGYALLEENSNKDYRRCRSAIQTFYDDFLNTWLFKKFIPLHQQGFLPVCPGKTDFVSQDSNQLLFGNNNTGMLPGSGMDALKPFRKSPYSNIQLFYIFNEQDGAEVQTIHTRLIQGYGLFKGMFALTGLLLYAMPELNIMFLDKDNPIPEIIEVLSDRVQHPTVKYLAIYVTPHGKNVENKQKHQIYFQLKERLLKYNIALQVINPVVMKDQGLNWQNSLTNIAVAILAKLDGIPWNLKAPLKDELIVGIGVHPSVDKGLSNVGIAISFSRNCHYSEMELFLKHNDKILASSMVKRVKQYLVNHSSLERLIIHVNYPVTEQELQAMLNRLKNEISVPVYVISVRKICSANLIAFDNNCNHMMPFSGTYIDIGNNKYLLFNNSRYINHPYNENEAFLLPIQLSLFSTMPEKLADRQLVKGLVEQVYQFSRLYWKSVSQQSLPVTVRYPEMVAQLADNFSEKRIPGNGKGGYWFL